MMKLPYRLAGLILGVSTCIIVYLTWGQGVRPGRQHANLNVDYLGGRTTRLVVQYEQECADIQQSVARFDINTNNLLKRFNKDLPTETAQDTNNFQPEKPNAPKNINQTLEVIVLPHSHSDPGWHKTLEGYFNDQTEPTLNNMVRKLQKYPKMTFIWAESVFLWLWWDKLSDADKKAVKQLISNNQLEVAVGSWVVPDEANPHYFAVIDQMIEGHQWLEKTIGVKPKNTWSLDPFGYSSTLAYLYKQAGYDHMVILRVHEKLKRYLQTDRNLEFYWRQHWDKRGETDIQTLMMPYKLYNIKHTCGPDHFVCLEFDFRQIEGEISESRAVPITDQNIAEKVDKLLVQYRKKASLYKHNVVLIPLGDDFRYDREVEWDQQYKNYMKIFNYINSRPEFKTHARFGTLQDYFNAVEKQMNTIADDHGQRPVFPSLVGDFFPYTDKSNEYWTGYFTTRPFHKKLGRELENFLRTADILTSIAMATSLSKGLDFPKYGEIMKLLTSTRQKLGLFQHHDAITGTAKEYVAETYINLLYEALTNAKMAMASAATALLKQKAPEGSTLKINTVDTTAMYNMRVPLGQPKDVIDVSVGGTHVVLHNPTATIRHELVTLIVNSDSVEVKDNGGRLVASQTDPVWTGVNTLSTMEYKLLFPASIPPLGMVKFTLYNHRGDVAKENTPASIIVINKNFEIPSRRRFKLDNKPVNPLILENSELVATFSSHLGTLNNILMKKTNQTTRVKAQPMLYKSRGSGAYLFYPSGPASEGEFSNRPVIRVIRGPFSQEIHVVQKFIEHRVRVVETEGLDKYALHIENLVDMSKTNDKELVLRFSTDVSVEENVFYTDLNGFQIMQRKTYGNFPIQANYYPMSTVAYLDDGHRRVSLISNQPVGVASLAPGQLEVMLDRKLNYDDGRGLGEGVNDNTVVLSQFTMLFESRVRNIAEAPPQGLKSSFPSLRSHFLINQLYHPIMTFTMQTSAEAWILEQPYTPLQQPFPCDMLLMNLRTLVEEHVSEEQPLSSGRSALLLHHLGFDCNFPTTGLQCQTSPGDLYPSSIFSDINVSSTTEASLSLMHNRRVLKPADVISVKPMQLAAYVLSYKKQPKVTT